MQPRAIDKTIDIRRELARDEDLAARFIQEAKATASVHHPNVVAITDFGELPGGTPYFVMELLVGQTLAQVIKAGGPIPAAGDAACARDARGRARIASGRAVARPKLVGRPAAT